MVEKTKKRILILTTARSYRDEAFISAAERLQIEVIQGIDTPSELADTVKDGLSLDFNKPDESLWKIKSYAKKHPLSAIMAVDDSGSMLAARASEMLHLAHNSIPATAAARDKSKMRQLLRKGGVPSPWSQRFSSSMEPAAIARQVPFPNVIKPLHLNGSRGVIRTNDEAELAGAIQRVSAMLRSVQGNSLPIQFLIEAYIPGDEIALEGLLDKGELHILTFFDKPDPMEGPYFEETIYVTPSRHPPEIQEAVKSTVARAARAIGLHTGPVHAEVRINEDGPWIVEIAGRSIGGLCAEVLQFGVESSLEELIICQACGLDWQHLKPAEGARGVMMIPIPEAGLLRRVEGVEQAENDPAIYGIKISARLNYPLIPLPEGDAYLGFIFARGDTPEAVEAALRQAHGKLEIVTDPMLPVLNF